jgi:uracil-DNA glycosylase
VDSYQNLALLENLYRLKSLGYKYVDPINPNIPSVATALPSSLIQLNTTIAQCHLCDLSKSRRQSMSGYGSHSASIMFVDAYVSAAEDEGNDYYAGRSGTMLRDMIEKVLGLSIEDVFLTHAVKCKPFGFQTPSASECNSCYPYLSRQVEMIAPSIIVALGNDAYNILTNDADDFDNLRGQMIPYGNSLLIPFYHPTFLLRNPSYKKDALRDLQIIKDSLK